jgi:hypothetical protein
MKQPGLILGALLASLCLSQAQVKVEVALDQDQFLPGETLPALVRITNRSGETLHLGADPDWLVFSVESRDGGVVLKTGDAPVLGEFSLESSKRAIKTVNLAPYFNLTKQGSYSIVATVTIKQWNRQIVSDPKRFDIINAAKLWEQEVGVPIPAGSTNPVPEIRKYALLEANYLQKHLMLYVQLTDSSGRFNKVFPIGPLLSFGQPQPEVDRFSNLHVLYQNGPHSFSYTIVDPSGKVIGRQTYDFTTRPRLVTDSNGNLIVSGGQRRLTPEDLPPPPAAETNSVASPP